MCTYLAVEGDVAGAEALIPRDSEMKLINIDQKEEEERNEFKQYVIGRE